MPPAIVIGGDENALSVGRNLAASGVEVHFLNKPGLPARYSRRGRWIEAPGTAPASWRDFLLGPASDPLRGAVLLTCSDEAIALVAENHAELSRKYLLEESLPEVRLRLLDKISTYECARDAGVPVPGFWLVENEGDFARALAECRFPAIVKPRRSYDAAKLGRKLLRAANPAELVAAHARFAELGIDALVMEVIPGGDDLLCSYYAYYDGEGKPLIRFTKRHPRRFPVGEGRATYHVTTWDPAVAELGDRLFRHAGLRGLGNVEFKRDPRDGMLKVIESNARFTAADALVTRCGIDFANFTYDRLTGRPGVVPTSYATDVVLWYPLEDFLSFLELRRRGELTWRAWLASIARADLFPYMRLDDPMPGIVNLAQRARSMLLRARRSRASLAGHKEGPVNGDHRSALSGIGRPGAG
jgi:predicted ATP-grasp superfamily ATP-dependent carboligase